MPQSAMPKRTIVTCGGLPQSGVNGNVTCQAKGHPAHHYETLRTPGGKKVTDWSKVLGCQGMSAPLLNVLPTYSGRRPI
jgi:hypothetical protein